MTGLLHPAIMEILLQQFARDTRLIPLLDRTCTAFRDQIVPSQEMRAVQAWLEFGLMIRILPCMRPAWQELLFQRA